jgi:trimeric autotransporter adhesin
MFITDSGYVSLSGNASAGGVRVALKSSNPTVLAVPASVVVPAGQSSAGFNFSTSLVTTPQTVTVSGSAGGITQSTQMLVQPLTFNSFTISPATVNGGASGAGVLTLPGPASVPIVVHLSSTSPAVVPAATVTIPTGASSYTFKLPTIAVSTNVTATVTATIATNAIQASLTVLAPTLVSVSVSPASVKGSSSTAVTGTVKISSAAPTGGLVLSISSSNGAVATVPASVTIAAGKTSATFKIGHSKVSAKISVALTAASGSSSASTSLTVTP